MHQDRCDPDQKAQEVLREDLRRDFPPEVDFEVKAAEWIESTP